jgi:hypothetical protein
MILYYPMIVSNTISPTIVPAIAKALERFVLIYKLNDITEDLGYALPNVRNVTTQNGVITANFGINESEALNEQPPLPPMKVPQSLVAAYGGGPRPPGTSPGTKTPEKPKEKDRPDMRNLSFGESDRKSLMLEPTYMMVEVNVGDTQTTKLLGIKVLPVMAKSDENLVDFLTYDRYVKGLRYMILKWGRSMAKALQNRWFRIKRSITASLPFVDVAKMPEPKGDPRQDILLRNTVYSSGRSSNMFVAINKADLGDDFMKTKAIRKLFKLGWDNMIFVDDVNKVVYFCFKTFRGMCSQIPYQMMYATLGREQREAYESVEDVRRASSSIFRRKANFKQVFESLDTGRSNKMHEIYLENKTIYSEIEFLTEDFSKYFNKINYKKLLPMLKSSYEKGNAKKFISAAAKMRLPAMDEIKIQQKMRQKYPEFNKAYQFAYRVLENSLPDSASNKMISLAAMSVALVAIRDKSMGVMKAATNAVKFLVRKFRKTQAQADRLKIPKAYLVDVALGWAAFGTILTAATIVTGIIVGGTLATGKAVIDIPQTVSTGLQILSGGGGSLAAGALSSFAANVALIGAAVVVITLLLKTLSDLMDARKESDID